MKLTLSFMFFSVGLAIAIPARKWPATPIDPSTNNLEGIWEYRDFCHRKDLFDQEKQTLRVEMRGIEESKGVASGCYKVKNWDDLKAYFKDRRLECIALVPSDHELRLQFYFKAKLADGSSRWVAEVASSISSQSKFSFTLSEEKCDGREIKPQLVKVKD